MISTILATASDSSASGGGALIILVFLGICLLLWLLPGIIASKRHHHNCASIWLVTIFLGWSFIGWVVALVWAFSNPAPIIIHQQQLPRS
jgi:hypothetical protein